MQQCTVLSGGAAQGVVHALAGRFREATGCTIVGTFGAVGAMKERLLARLRPHPNGAAAMQAMALASETGRVGCTQITEINATPGVRLAGALPRQFELATVYTAGVCARAAAPEAARRLVALLAGEASRELRASAGFEF